MKNEGGIHSNLAIPPGEFLEEVLNELGMTKDDLARRMGRPATKLSPIFKGEKAITPDTALQLETVVGVPAHIWTGLESEYRLTLARLEDQRREEKLDEEVELLPKFPLGDLVKAGEIQKKTNPKEKVRELQNYFGVVSLKNIHELQRYQPAFRIGRSSLGERSPEAVAAWLRMGERQAQKIETAPYNKDRLIEALKDIRSMTLLSPDTFQEPLKKKLAESGVALVVCPHFSKTKTHGATFWLGNEKAVLMITIRGKWADVFWFSLFHEIGHILLHGSQAIILEDKVEDKRETEADRFAAEKLIPSEAYKLFTAMRPISLDKIKRFARTVGIDPGIVVGRLQHDDILPIQTGNHLRSRYCWAIPNK